MLMEKVLIFEVFDFQLSLGARSTEQPRGENYEKDGVGWRNCKKVMLAGGEGQRRHTKFC